MKKQKFALCFTSLSRIYSHIWFHVGTIPFTYVCTVSETLSSLAVLSIGYLSFYLTKVMAKLADTFKAFKKVITDLQ